MKCKSKVRKTIWGFTETIVLLLIGIVLLGSIILYPRLLGSKETNMNKQAGTLPITSSPTPVTTQPSTPTSKLVTTSPTPSMPSRSTPSPTPIQSPTPTPTPTPQPQSQGNCSPANRETFVVKPYLVYPADKPVYTEYETAVRNYMNELQKWYCDKVGATFPMSPLQVIRSQYNYLTMRCGDNPSQDCINDPKKLDGNWGSFMNRAIHNGAESWDQQTATLVFSAGGGGYAGANLYQNYTGFAITGDWVLEPMSGVTNEWGIPCKYSDGWQCTGGVPKGSPAHELGHAFGLPHPDSYSGNSIMKWHGGYPAVGFLPHEIEQFRQSPFFK